MCQIVANEIALCCCYKSVLSKTVSSNLQGASSVFLHSIHIISPDHYGIIELFVLSNLNHITLWL